MSKSFIHVAVLVQQSFATDALQYNSTSNPKNIGGFSICHFTEKIQDEQNLFLRKIYFI